MKIQFIFSGTRFVTQSRQNSCCKRPFMLEKQTSRDLIFISIYKWTKFLTQNKKKATLSNQSFKLAICSFINFKVWSAAIISLRRNHPQDKFADWEGCDLKLSGWNEHWFLGLISGLKCDKCGSYCRPRPKPLSTFFTETSIFVIVTSLFAFFLMANIQFGKVDSVFLLLLLLVIFDWYSFFIVVIFLLFLVFKAWFGISGLESVCIK